MNNDLSVRPATQQKMLDALYLILNIEGLCMSVEDSGCDIEYHFNAVRDAIREADPFNDFLR